MVNLLQSADLITYLFCAFSSQSNEQWYPGAGSRFHELFLLRYEASNVTVAAQEQHSSWNDSQTLASGYVVCGNNSYLSTGAMAANPDLKKQ